MDFSISAVPPSHEEFYPLPYISGHHDDEDSNGVDNNLRKDDTQVVPAVGMSFNSVEEAKTVYRKYAIEKGFGIRTRTSKKGPDNELRYLLLVCARAGTYVSSIPTEVATKPIQSIQCGAHITVGKKDGKWFIMSVNHNHSHELSPTKSRLFRGNRRMNLHVKRTLDMNDEAGVRVNKSFRSLVSSAGGYDNVEFIERDVRNYVGQQRNALVKHGDAKALLSHFSRMCEMNKDFYFEIDIDEDSRIRNVFWADARSRAACKDFGDVISFDTTYLTNKYDMPFAPFVGVNHHGHSILLGCGLLSSEDTSSFIWLFECWLRCMSNKAPQGIVTDQCKAMKNAIQCVLPNTRHRWCLWHIMKKIPEKLQRFIQYKDMKHMMKSVVYESSTIVEFERDWDVFVTKYDLGGNEWLTDLYEERYRWVPCFLKQHFWAGMSTTQRSEGMNAFFDGYINSTTTLQQFVMQYDNALQHKAEKEYEADFASMTKVIPCGSQSLLERQFQNEYTHSKFQEIQLEFRGKMNCVVDKLFVEGEACRYDVVEEEIHNGKPQHKNFIVGFNRANMNINCSCMLFEFRGILCRHSLLVFAQERVSQAPQKYILRRWSKNVRRKHSYIRASYGSKDKEPHIERYDGLCTKFYEIAEYACESENTTEMLHQLMNSFATKDTIKENSSRKKKKSMDQVVCQDVPSPSSPMPNTVNVNSSIRSPNVVNRKGRPKFSRLKSRSEVIGKRKRTTTPTTIETTHVPVTYSDVNVGNENQFNTTMSTYSDSQTVSPLPAAGFMSLLNTVFTKAHNGGN